MPTNPPLRYTPDLEHVEEDEEQTIEGLNEAFDTILETTSQNYGHAVRAVHAKGHGLLKGTLTVLDDLPEEFAQGVFATPGAHEAWMRISTNPGDIVDDAVSLPRGFALKIAGVAGERLPDAEGDSQDFVFVNGPIFQAKTSSEFLGNLKMLAGTTDRIEGVKKVLSTFLRGANAAMASIGKESPKVHSLGGAPNVDPLGETYYSATPFRYGDYVAKFSLAPVSDDLTARTGESMPIGDDSDAIRNTVRDEMKAIEGRWELRVQLCRDLEKQPVEDPTVQWDEESSPFHTVAILEAGPQDSWSAEKVAEIDEGMRFSVWTGITAHKPLGSINRARKATYRHSAGFRERFNRCPIHEPHA
ncbi:catalase family protein [Pararhizobium mangrovi]|uniref:Catalase family protein n=1 Tax=Pararhizobium mangrovi TaxID=2590452 RepID=A0A506UCL9_9HYPH|nr:catalase family protein [Pararhizobium mangrovi]TPW31348.1 catalase family protein [Pararhizobium mangrovi]